MKVGIKAIDALLEWPDGKLRKPSLRMPLSVWVQTVQFDKPKTGSVAPSEGWQRSTTSTPHRGKSVAETEITEWGTIHQDGAAPQ